MFTVRFFIATPSKTHEGFGMSRSPKVAVRAAKRGAWDKLTAFDGQHGLCSSIGMEWIIIHRNGSLVLSDESYS